MWYCKFCTDLEGIVFGFKPYDPCIAHQITKGRQHLIQFHVDDVLSSHVDAKVNNDFDRWDQETYLKLKPVEIRRVKNHTFLGMKLVFLKSKECHVLQEGHIEDIVRMCPEKINNKKELTLSTLLLFAKGKDGLLDDDRKEIFH